MRIKVLYRKNLKMSPGKLAAQSVHAALGLASWYPKALSPEHSVVVLEASDKKFEEAKKQSLERSLTSTSAYVVRDKGLTEVQPGTETVLAVLETDNPDVVKRQPQEP